MNCPTCGSDDFVTIMINLNDDDSVQFVQCRVCENKWWKKDGDDIALDQVLDLASEVKDRK